MNLRFKESGGRFFFSFFLRGVRSGTVGGVRVESEKEGSVE